MALQLVYRAARPSLTTTTATPSAISFITHSTRPLSLSSTLQKTAPGGWTRSDSKSGEKGLNYAERKRAREELTAQRPTYKIHKGRKDITEYPDKARPQSRQSRFYDPQSTHGKKSLVYKLKTGQLAEELKEIQAKTGQLPDSLSAFMTSKGEQVRDNKFTRKERAREGGRDKGIANADDIAAMIRGEEPKSRGFGGSRDKDFKGSRDRDFKSPRDRAFGNKDRGFGGGRDRDSRPPRDNAFGGARDRDARPSRDGGFRDRDSRPTRDGGFGGVFGGGRDRNSGTPRDGGFGGGRDRDSRPPRDGGFGGFGGSRDARPPRDNAFGGGRDRDSRPPRNGAFGGRDRDSRPPRDNAFGASRDARPSRNNDFGSGRDRDSRPPRDGDFAGARDRDSRPPRDNAFGSPRDSRPPHDNAFSSPRDNAFGSPRDSKPPRDNAFSSPRDNAFGSPRDSKPPRDNAFSSPRDANPRRTFGDKPDFTSRNRDDRPPRSSSFSSPGSDFKERSFDRPPRSSSSPPPRSDFKERSFDRPSTSSELRPRRNDPISIPYTTAASQFLYGKSVVEAALNSSRRKLYKLYIYHGDNRQNVEDNNQLRNLATRKGVEVVILRSEDDLRLLDKMAASRPHNGFVLEASPLPEPPLKSLGPVPEVQEEYAANPGFPFELGHQSAEEAAINGAETFIPSKSVTHRPLVLVLDRILDPGNLGAILRTANFLGVTAVGITKFGGAKLTPVALKASSGASESMNLFSISSLPEFLNSSRANGWVTYAAVAKEPSVHRLRRHLDLYDVEKTDPLKTTPCILIIGSEGEGLDRLVVKKADYELSVPNMSGSGAVDSLNVGIAAGLLCTSFLKGMTRELNGVFESKMVEEGQEVRAEGDLW